MMDKQLYYAALNGVQWILKDDEVARELATLRAEVEFHKGQFNVATSKWGECAAEVERLKKDKCDYCNIPMARIGVGHEKTCPVIRAEEAEAQLCRARKAANKIDLTFAPMAIKGRILDVIAALDAAKEGK